VSYTINRSTKVERASLILNHPGLVPKEWHLMKGNTIVSWYDTEHEAFCALSAIILTEFTLDSFFDWAIHHAVTYDLQPSSVIDIVRKVL